MSGSFGHTGSVMPARSRLVAAVFASVIAILAAVTAPSDALAEKVKADTFTIDYPPLGFKVAIAVPQQGHLCIIVPESAQEPTACMGLDPAAMTDALPQGPDRPFGVAYARMGEWSYIVMTSPIGTGIESKEDIDEFVAAAAKPDPDAPGVVPKLIGPSPDKTYEIIRVGQVPVVKFRLDSGAAPGSPGYDVSSMIHYAAFGSKTAMISFITSPKDVDQVMPFAEATIQSLALPPRESPERFGKPRAELEGGSTRTAVMVLGPLVALGALLFIWLGKGKKEDEPSPSKGKPSHVKSKAKRRSEEEEEEQSDEEDDQEAEGETDEAEGEEGSAGDEESDAGDEESDAAEDEGDGGKNKK